VGSAADTWRIADARHRSRRINRGEVYDQEAGTALPGLENFPAQSCRRDRVHRSVRGSRYFLQVALWPGDSSPRPKATGEHRRDGLVDRGSGD